MEYGFYNHPSTDYHIKKKKTQAANNNYTSKNKESDTKFLDTAGNSYDHFHQ